MTAAARTQPDDPSDVSGADRWLLRHRAWVLAFLLGTSVLVRAVYWVQLVAGPCRWQHLWRESDMHFFDLWARQIAAGDWLTDAALHPYTEWQREVADIYLAEHPDERAADAAAGRAVWQRWWGGKTFHQEPLYAYLVAASYALLAPDVRVVFAWQLLLGVLSNLLIYLIARRHFGETAGVVAGVLALLSGPLLLYEMVLLRTTVIMFTTLALVHVTDAALERPTRARWLGAGILFGLSLLVMTSFALFVAGVLAVLACRARGLAGRLPAVAAGIVLGLAPLVARNLAVGAAPLGVASVAGVVYVAANTEDYPGDGGFFFSMKHGPRILGETDGRLLPAAVATLRTHPDVTSYLRQLGAKLGAVWRWYEEPNNVNYYYYRLHAGVLRLTCVGFAFVGPLALVGLALAGRHADRHLTLFLMVLNGLAPMLVFYVLSRFRVPLAATFIPFSALAIVRIAAWLARRRWLPAVSALTVAGALSLWMLRPLPGGRPAIRPVDHVIPYEIYYAPAINEAVRTGRLSDALALYRTALRVQPPIVHRLGPARPAESESERGLADVFAEIYRRYADTLAEAGEPRRAAAMARRAAALEAAITPPPSASGAQPAARAAGGD